jgi:DNA-binding NarL/FixJ family response regulator
MSTRLFIVDDHYMVIEGIRTLLQTEQQLEWLGHATTAAACLSFLKQQQPDVIFMDIGLPDKSGIDLCREVSALYPSIGIIGLSTFHQESYIRKMMESGALSYLLKNATCHELMQAINTVAKGKRYLSQDVVLALRKSSGQEIPAVTRREREVLELIAKGMTSNEIAQQLYVSITTIHTHRKSLLSKFNLNNTAALIRTAIDHNLIAPDKYCY